MSAVIAASVCTLEDAQRMRVIRNECRLFMTRSTDEVTEEQQALWWDYNRDHISPFLYFARADRGLGDPLGYGIVRREQGSPLLTGGVREWARGKGYGEAIFRHLILAAGVPCRLEVRVDNTIAKHLYENLGFEYVGLAQSNADVDCMLLSPQDALRKGSI